MSIDSDVIRGHVDTIILKTLTTGDKYGYEIIKEIEQKSNGTYELKQPTLYSCLKRLESQGLISAFWKNSDIGGKRHYYRLTKKGRQTYEESMQSWFNSRSIIDNLMGTKPTILTMADEDDSPTAPDTFNPDEVQESTAPEPELIMDTTEKDSAQMVLDEESNITQETEPRDFTIEDLDESDAALIEDYYKTDENQIDLFAGMTISHSDEDETIEDTNEENELDTSVSEDEDKDIVEPAEETFKYYDGTDVSKYRTNTSENYFDKISYGVADEKDVDVTETNTDKLINEDHENETSVPEHKSVNLSSFGFFTNFPTDEEDEETETNNTELEEDSFPTFPTDTDEQEDDSREPLHFGFGYSNDEDEDETTIPHEFMDMDDLENSEPEDVHPTISIFGEEEETDDNSVPVSYSDPDFTPSEHLSFEYSDPATYPDLKPLNLDTYTEPEYKEKLNQLSAYAKSNYETQPNFIDTEDSRAEAKSISELKEDLSSLGIDVRTYARPEREALKDKKHLLVNKIKFVASWITFGIITLFLALAYLVAKKVGYTDFSLVSTSLTPTAFFLIAGAVAMVVPIVYTTMYLLNKTKKVKPNYNAVISFIFALLFFVVCLNIIYTLNILNGFTKFSQADYNHLLWLLPSVVSLLIVVQSLVYSLLFKTRRFHA